MTNEKGTENSSAHRMMSLQAPLVSFMMLLFAIFLSESIIIIVLDRLPFSGLLEAFVGAAAITLFMGPIAYLVVLRPLFSSIKSMHEAKVEKEISADHYHRLIELSPSGTIILEDDIIQFANIAAVSMMAADWSWDVIGRSVLDMFTPESRENMKKCIATSMNGYAVTPGMHLELKCSGDKTMHVEATTIPMAAADETGLLLLLTDTTERYAAEQALLSANESFESIIMHSVSGYLIVDDGSIIRFVNDTAAHMLRTRPADLINMAFELPINQGSKREIEIASQAAETGLAEVHFSSTRWKNGPATLVALRDVTESVRLRDELRTLSISDELTGVYNRRGFMELAEHQLKVTKRSAASLSVLFIDLDKMKWINDTLGHEYGDMALREISGILKDMLRESDLIGRMGGDEFAVIVIGATPNSEEALAENIRKNVETANAQKDRKYMLEYSVGYIRYDPEKHRTLSELLASADTLMYQEKQRKQAARYSISSENISV